ncbi:glycosyltransferase family 2 protein [Candidatus Gottesmanbacteria bacterium]|nr:glycosyltransferase family 2 protein [Candidatus Gottesmanbacteria bacterium]
MVDFLSGAAMFIRTDVIKQIGLFDPRFFVYLEELDFAARAKKAGYNCIYSPAGQVRHKGRHSIDKRYKPPYVEGSARNYMLLIRKHSGKQKVQFMIRATTVIGKSIVGIIAKEKNPRQLINLIKSMRKGLK